MHMLIIFQDQVVNHQQVILLILLAKKLMRIEQELLTVIQVKLRKYFTQISILLICCSIISRQPDQPVFFCPHFCFSRIQSSLKCISFMIHFTLMVIKLTIFCPMSVVTLMYKEGLMFHELTGDPHDSSAVQSALRLQLRQARLAKKKPT